MIWSRKILKKLNARGLRTLIIFIKCFRFFSALRYQNFFFVFFVWQLFSIKKKWWKGRGFLIQCLWEIKVWLDSANSYNLSLFTNYAINCIFALKFNNFFSFLSKNSAILPLKSRTVFFSKIFVYFCWIRVIKTEKI